MNVYPAFKLFSNGQFSKGSERNRNSNLLARCPDTLNNIITLRNKSTIKTEDYRKALIIVTVVYCSCSNLLISHKVNINQKAIMTCFFLFDWCVYILRSSFAHRKTFSPLYSSTVLAHVRCFILRVTQSWGVNASCRENFGA